MKQKIIFFTLSILFLLNLILFNTVYINVIRVLVINYTDLKNVENKDVFINKHIENDWPHLRLSLDSALKRNELFWDEPLNLPLIIFCSDSGMVKKYNHDGWGNKAISVFTAFNSYMVVNPNGWNANVLSHEISHHVIYTKLSGFKWFKTNFILPVWLDEGIAMQVDYRLMFSEDNMYDQKEIINSIRLNSLSTANNFYNQDSLWFYYAKSKYAVAQYLDTVNIEELKKKLSEY